MIVLRLIVILLPVKMYIWKRLESISISENSTLTTIFIESPSNSEYAWNFMVICFNCLAREL